MRVGVLFSGGKDSAYAAWTAKKQGHELCCLISLFSQNPDSYMFHTPNIKLVRYQAKAMGLPLITWDTKGKKENELNDLEAAIKAAVEKYKIQGIVTGAIRSVYQSSRVQKICRKFNLKCISPLWLTDELQYLQNIIKSKFKVVIVGVAAYPLDNSWIGRQIDKQFIYDVADLNHKYKIHPAGEGGEFETFVLDCPLFTKKLKIKGRKIFGKKNSWRMSLNVELMQK